MPYDNDLFNSPDAIVVLNDGETYTGMGGCSVYLLDESVDSSDYDVSTFAEDITDHPGVQILSIERLVEMYIAFQSMNVHAFNVTSKRLNLTNAEPNDLSGTPTIDQGE